MPITGKQDQITEEGNEKTAFVVTFSNGALEQLETLKAHYNQADLTEVIKLGVSFLQQIKERKEEQLRHSKNP